MPTKPVNVKPVLVYVKHEQHAKLLRHKERTHAPMRLNIASERLRTTDDKISLIAAAAAYKSLPAFSKAF